MKGASRSAGTLAKSTDWRSVISRMRASDPRMAAKGSVYSYSLRLQDLSSLEDITALLSELQEHHLFPTIVMMNQLINKMGQLQNVSAALELHDIAVEKKMANAITYASTINAIARNRDPDAKLAVHLLNEAKKLGYADSVTYASTIDAIAKSREPDADLALQCLDEASDKFSLPDLQRTRRIDLHGLSFGEVYFGFKRRLQAELDGRHAEPTRLGLIYGKGLHSHACSVSGMHPVKEAVNRVLEEMAAPGISCKESKYNSGRAELTIQPSSCHFSLFASSKKRAPLPESQPLVKRLTA